MPSLKLGNSRDSCLSPAAKVLRSNWLAPQLASPWQRHQGMANEPTTLSFGAPSIRRPQQQKTANAQPEKRRQPGRHERRQYAHFAHSI